MVLPHGLMPWNSTFALQASRPGAGRGHGAHFTAQSARLLSRRSPQHAGDRRGVCRGDAQGTATGCGKDEALRDVGPNSIAFLTNIEPRGLPLDWRVKLNYVQADYSADGATLYSLRPAQYITDSTGSGWLSHAWMLPEGAVQKLRAGAASARAHVFVDAAETARVPRPHGREAARVARSRILQRRGRRARKSHRRRLLQGVHAFRADQRGAERDLREPRLQPGGFRARLRAMAVTASA